MDLLVIIVFLLTIFVIFALAIRKPYVSIGRHHLETYAVAALIGPVLLFIAGYVHLKDLGHLFAGSTNPMTILVLFLSMVFISVYLDNVGFMEYCAKLALRMAKGSGKRLFFSLYAVVSFLTIFTSNDIIILTLTPFIFYFARHAGLDPKPYLIAEFFAANTWSILLQIGNPTNIYITTSFGLGFMEYLKVMLLPTFVAGLLNLALLYLIFMNHINTRFTPEKVNPSDALHDKPGAVIGLALLLACIVALSLSPYFEIPLWQVAFGSAIILLVIIMLRDGFSTINHVLHKMPWSVIPFVFSFFVMVEVLSREGFISALGAFLQGTGIGDIFSFGISSALLSNVLNNIPMTVAYSSLSESLGSIYATVIGSNIGAYFTPLGALAGIMWMSILKHKRVELSYHEFIGYGVLIGSIVLIGALDALSISLR
jgi:arsenical pump membrane protein